MQNDRHLGAHAAMLANSILFGLNTSFGKEVLSNGAVSPLALNTFRVTGAALLFWAVSLFLPREKVDKRDLPILFIASLFAVQINQLTFLLALSMTTAVNCAIINTTLPIFTMLMAAAYLHEPITWKKGLGVAVGAAGAVTLILSSNGMLGGGNIKGDLLCLLSASLYACYLVFFKRIINTYSAVTLMKWMFLFAAICTAPVCWGDFAKVDFASLSAADWGDIAFVVIGATFITYLLIPVGQRNLRPTVVSMYNYIQPIVAMLVSIIMFGEMFTWYKAVAMLLVFAGVRLVTRSRSRAQMVAQRHTARQ